MGRVDDTEELVSGAGGSSSATELDRTETLALFEEIEAGATSELPKLEARMHVGRYELVEVVGRGGMGVVYAAHDPELDRRVALKLVREELADSEAARDRLIREAQAAAKLAHPNLVRIYDAGAIGRRFYVAMEWVDGETLSQWLASAPRSVEEKIGIFRQLASGLRAVHQAGWVHRDIKPSNLMVCRDGRALVVDFGLARAARSLKGEGEAGSQEGDRISILPTSRLRGTYGYIAPEQLRGERLDPRIDQFAFGVVLYEALVGRHPFGARTPGESPTPMERISKVLGAIEKGPAAIEPEIAARIPPALLTVVHRALSASPGDRFASMAELEEALGASGDESLPASRGPRDGSGPVDSAERPAGKARGAWRAPVLFVAALLVGALVAGPIANRFGGGPVQAPEVPGGGSDALAESEIPRAPESQSEKNSDDSMARAPELEPVHALLDARKLDLALEAASKKVVEADERGDDRVAAEARLLKAAALVGKGDYVAAEPLLERAVELAYASGADALVARLATDMVVFGVLRQDPDQAGFWLGLAEAAVERQGNPPSLVTQLLYSKARLEWSAGNPGAVIELLAELLRIGTDDESLQRSAHGLLVPAYRRNGDLEAAAKHGMALLELSRQAHAGDSPALVRTESTVSELQLLRGNLEVALDIVSTSLARADRFRIDLPDVYSMRVDHGEILRRLGRMEEAEPILVQAMESADRRVASAAEKPVTGAYGLTLIRHASARSRYILARVRQARDADLEEVRTLIGESIDLYLELENRWQVDRWKEERSAIEAHARTVGIEGVGDRGEG